jgi:hypothetical protein
MHLWGQVQHARQLAACSHGHMPCMLHLMGIQWAFNGRIWSTDALEGMQQSTPGAASWACT